MMSSHQKKNGRKWPELKLNPSRDTLIKAALITVFTLVIDFALLWEKDVTLQTIIGSSLLIALLLVIIFRDSVRFKPEITKDYKLMILAGTLLSGNLLIGHTMYFVLEGFTAWLGTVDPALLIFAIPLATASMLAALLIDMHTAIIFTVITSLIAGLWLESPLYSIYIFVTGLVAAFELIRCKKRSAIWRAGLYVSTISVLTVLTMMLYGGNFISTDTLIVIGAAFFNGIFIAIIVSAMLPLFEYMFGLTTDISLLELVDLNHPLMRELLVEAPGTYHHSIIVGNLAETAAEAVGVNPLLARVSAYYHDIGKIKMPDYFVENQLASESRHDKLAPRMSSLILLSHVKEGVELAKKYKLPQVIIDTIQQHHGTAVQTYFYQKAKDQPENFTPPTEEDFRYPGPKPNSRVSALVLMADAVEAASRVLTDTSPARVSLLVDKIVNHCLIDGQLDNCELSLKDIREIKTNFVYLLSSMYHKRINYPGFEIKDEDTHPKPATTSAFR